MLLIALGWGAFAGSIAALVMVAAIESSNGQGLPGGRKRRLIESGRLCECGHGVWMHRSCRHPVDPVGWLPGCRQCACAQFTPRMARGNVPPAKMLKAPEMYRRLMATCESSKGGEIDVET